MLVCFDIILPYFFPLSLSSDVCFTLFLETKLLWTGSNRVVVPCASSARCVSTNGNSEVHTAVTTGVKRKPWDVTIVWETVTVCSCFWRGIYRSEGIFLNLRCLCTMDDTPWHILRLVNEKYFIYLQIFYMLHFFLSRKAKFTLFYS